MSRRILIILIGIFLQLPVGFNLFAQDTITVGIYQNEPLVFEDTDGKVKGIYIDILEHIAAKQGWQMGYRLGSWEECLKWLKLGQIDLITAIAYSDERNQQFDFNSETVVVNWGQVYVPKISEIRSFVDLTGRKMAVLKGDVYYHFFR